MFVRQTAIVVTAGAALAITSSIAVGQSTQLESAALTAVKTAAIPVIDSKADNVKFGMERAYALGVSWYEIAGRRVNRKLQDPYFGAGEIAELVLLRF